jgi:hypothetical protein
MSNLYAICFDFPELEGQPLFAGWAGDQLGFAYDLRTAAKFDTEEIAENHLRNNWGKQVNQWGTVVEVEGVKP